MNFLEKVGIKKEKYVKNNQVDFRNFQLLDTVYEQIKSIFSTFPSQEIVKLDLRTLCKARLRIFPQHLHLKKLLIRLKDSVGS